MSGSGTSAMPPTDAPEAKLFEGVFTNKDGVIQIDMNKLGDDTETAIQVGKVLGGKILTAADEKITGFMATLRQHVDAAAAEVKTKRATKSADPIDLDKPPTAPSA